MNELQIAKIGFKICWLIYLPRNIRAKNPTCHQAEKTYHAGIPFYNYILAINN